MFAASPFTAVPFASAEDAGPPPPAPTRRFAVPLAARPVVLAAYRRIVPDKAEPGPPPATP